METNQVQHSLQSANGLIQAETIKGIDQHLDANKPLEEGEVKSLMLSDPGNTLTQVYAIARPVLTFLEAALFVAPGWHKAIKALVAAMDTLIANAPAATDKMPM